MTNHLGLIILDGWGIGDGSQSDAIAQAQTPYMDSLLQHFPHATLLTSGENVGLPSGQMGNSEVGHLNIGAGRIVYQELTRINKSIREGDFFTNPVLVKAMQEARASKLHLIGLVSEGGVHSSQAHLYALCDMAKQHQVDQVFIHAFTDGRDCDPKSGLGYIQQLENHLKTSVGKIASIIGRYYSMDRDNRWERVKKAYDLLVNGIGTKATSATESIAQQYGQGITDEFLEPFWLRTMGLLPKLKKEMWLFVLIFERTAQEK
jgi:2,3-bisphosphoglycerate-independent phosphoglycerate mutase